MIRLLLAALLVSTSSWAADLYVSTTGSDSNTGTLAAPFRTILRASQSAQPGTTVYVSPGVYSGGFRTTANGTASARIRYLSSTKWGAKIRNTGSGTYGWQELGNYTTIEGFEIDGSTGTGWRHGLKLTGSYTQALNNHIHHIASSEACDSNGGAGILLEPSYPGSTNLNQQGDEIYKNIVHHVGPSMCETINGIYVANQRFKVKNNLVYRISGDGIVTYHDANIGDVVNNTVFNCDYVGINISGGGSYFLSGIADYFNVHNNIVYSNGYGIVEGGVGTHNTYNNNLSVNNKTLNLSVATSQSNNITSGTPGFVNYQSDGSGDYHLASGSQAIDKGLSTLAPTDDLDGHSRPQGAAVDLGAYEFGSSTPTPSPAPAPIVKVSSTQLTAGQSFTVSVSGSGASASEYVALYLASSLNSDLSYQGQWMYLNGSQTEPAAPLNSATLQFKAPMEAGTYNIRLFGSADAGNLLASSPNISVAVAPAVDTIAPTTNLTSPSSGTVPRGSQVTMVASAQDNVAVTKVEFYVNGNLKCTDTVAPYACSFTVSTRRGVQYNLKSKAYDAAGNVGISSVVTIQTKR